MIVRYLILLFLLAPYKLVFTQNPIEKQGWELTFNDEFNNQQLDDIKWQNYYYWGGRFNKGDITYYGENQFQFTDSTLKIVAEKKGNPENLPYTSGMIDCNKSLQQQYGYFEIRSKLPNSTGFLPAFWLVSVEKWPPEVDIYEIYTNNLRRISTTQHWLNRRAKKKMQPKSYKIADASKDFHTYALEWTPKKIIWYYDNQKIRTSRRGVKYFKHKMHIIINLHVSKFKGMILEDAIFPNFYEIDYVRVYRRKE